VWNAAYDHCMADFVGDPKRAIKADTRATQLKGQFCGYFR
jgi:hypothetical protein